MVKIRPSRFPIELAEAGNKTANLFCCLAGCYNVFDKSVQPSAYERKVKLVKINYQYEKRQKELEKKKKKEQKLRRKEIKKNTQQVEETPAQPSEKKEIPPA